MKIGSVRGEKFSLMGVFLLFGNRNVNVEGWKVKQQEILLKIF